MAVNVLSLSLCSQFAVRATVEQLRQLFLVRKVQCLIGASRSAIPNNKKGSNSPSNIYRNFPRLFQGNIDSRAKRVPPYPFYTTS